MRTIKYLLLTALIVSAACSSATRTTTENTNVNWQNVSDSTTTAAVSPTPAVETQTPKVAPDTLVKDLHKQHDAQKGPFFQTKDRALVDKYFDKALAGMIWKDAKESKGEIGAIDFDPLYYAQDVEIKNLNVGEPKINGDRAEVVVTFNNYNEKKRFTYSLTKQNGEWKISDINYGDGSTLVKIFKENEKSASETNSPTGEFEGRYQIGDTTCTVTPVKMAFEVRWAKGTGVEMFYADTRDSDKFTFSSSNPSGKGTPNVFSFDDENYNSGTFYRHDGKEFPITRVR